MWYRPPRAALVLAVSIIVTCPSAFGGSNEAMRISLDIRAADPDRGCALEYSSCGEVVPQVSATGTYDVLVVASGVSSVRALGFAIRWPESWSFGGFTSCSDLTTSDPLPGATGLALMQGWTDSLTAPGSQPVLLGWIRLGAVSAGSVELRPLPGADAIEVVDPQIATDVVARVGTAGIGGVEGVSVCE